MKSILVQEISRAEFLESRRRYYREHKAEFRKRSEKWRIDHPDRWREILKKSRVRPEAKAKAADNQRRWASDNRAWVNERARLYRIRNRERINAKNRQTYKEHPERLKSAASKRRALEKNATVNLLGIQEWMRKVRNKSRVKCYYCGRMIAPSSCHFDHIVALSMGGAHSAENLCVSCAKCNLSKNNRPVRVWIRSGQQLLEL